MKKALISLCVIAVSAMCAYAQTDFRHITFDEAKAAAKAEGKNIFVDFYTTWCGPCKRLASHVFPTRQVGDYLNSNYVCLKLDAEKEGADLAKAIKVQAYPTLAVFDAEGQLLGSFAGLKEGEDFIVAVDALRDPELKPERVRERYAAGERTPGLILAYAGLIKESNPRDYVKGMEEATKIVDEYYSTLTDSQRLQPENLFVFTGYTNDYSSPRLKFILDNKGKFPADALERLSEVVRNVYFSEAQSYFLENRLADANARPLFDKFRNEVQALGYNESLGDMLRFAEKRAATDDSAFLDFCDKNLASLSDQDKYSLMYGITRMVAVDTPEQKQAVCALIRKHIGSLPTDAIYTAAMSLLQLERGH